MARTKVPKASKKKETDCEIKLQKELEIMKKYEIQQIEKFRALVLKKIDEDISFIKLKFLGQTKTIKELRQLSDSTMMKTACDSTNQSIVNTVPKHTKPKRSLSCAPDDDGYLTGDSASSRSATRMSRSRSKGPLANSTVRASRSLSRPRNQTVPKLITNTNNKNQGYKTPIGKKPNNSYGMVTPKMQPNMPQVILRRPKHGEVAISMEGSPLMVNPVDVDSMANVNIPLGEGKLLSLQPQRGLRISQLPKLDAETQRQLQTLKDHIETICAASKRI